jgi:hypothetical protein
MLRIFLTRRAPLSFTAIGKEESPMVNYPAAVLIFCLGVFTTVCLVAYILYGNKKYRDQDPFAEDESEQS